MSEKNYKIIKLNPTDYKKCAINTIAWHLYETKGFNTVLFDGADAHGEYVKLLKSL